jgi:hypothetical protein
MVGVQSLISPQNRIEVEAVGHDPRMTWTSGGDV